MTASTQADGSVAVRGSWKWRLGIVLLAAVAAVLVFLVADAVVDGDIRTPAIDALQQPATTLNAGSAAFVALMMGLLGWALLALLERFTAKGRTIWITIAALFTLLSLAGPLSGTGTNTASRVSLVLLHLTVGAVLITLLPGRVIRRG